MFKTVRKKSKKGFTLAELLVVVAIIAILVAIAIPIFTGALNRAREAVKQANIRSVKGAAVAAILTNWEHYGYYEPGDTSTTMETAWVATAEVSANGDITSLSITGKQGVTSESAGVATPEDDGGYTVTAYINSLSTPE